MLPAERSPVTPLPRRLEWLRAPILLALLSIILPAIVIATYAATSRDLPHNLARSPPQSRAISLTISRGLPRNLARSPPQSRAICRYSLTMKQLESHTGREESRPSHWQMHAFKSFYF